MGCWHRIVLVVVLVSATATACLVAPGAGADPIEDARKARAETQAAADTAAQRYADALSEQARQEAEIARLEAEIPRLRARADELKVQVRERAVALYQQGSSMPLSRMVEAESVVDAARAINLTANAAIYDRDVAQELTHTAAQLTKDEAELKTRKAAQDALVVQLEQERAALDAALAAADAALMNLEKVGFTQAMFRDVFGAAAGQVATGASVCPVFGTVTFTNDWGAPRSGGRTHQGTDMLALWGTPLVAVVDGVIRHDVDDLGGVGVWLDGTDGVSYYYAHLSRWEGENRIVARGEIIGYVGDTGNAAGGPPHLHFGIRATHGEMVNPYPTVRALCTI
jgi:murein DD-endopeptidase MepM/ murein hydrolase activator NlpD